MKLELTPQLAGLLMFTGQVAIAISLYSAYNSEDRTRAETAPDDLMWLSDCLHNFEMLGGAIVSGDPKKIVNLCDCLIERFTGYQVVNPQFERQAKPTFDRNAQLVSLDRAIELLDSIRIEVNAQWSGASVRTLLELGEQIMEAGQVPPPPIH